jgi:hypothetical protein
MEAKEGMAVATESSVEALLPDRESPQLMQGSSTPDSTMPLLGPQHPRSPSFPVEAATPTNTTRLEDRPDPVPPSSSTVVVPCLEQPLRVTLHCRGYYIWGLRNGSVICRKKRSDRDEFRLTYHKDGGGIVEITHHKFGGKLAVLDHGIVACVQDTPTTFVGSTTDPEKEEEGDDDDDKMEDEPALITTRKATQEDRQWCFVKGTHGRNEVLLKSLRTGENLGIDAKGNLVLTASDNPQHDDLITILWDIECVTGELCFISNPSMDSRHLRCDMAGLLTLTDSCKGWEVFRLMEAGHGYVKISSWMHSQWLLCSTADGTVTTCSHAESFLQDNLKGCPKWAIEKAPDDREGVIIRNKSYGRLLSIQEGVLKTYDPLETFGMIMATASSTQQQESHQYQSTIDGNNNNNWWNSSVKGLQKRFSASSIRTDVREQDTTVWQLEAAHLQTYYFISSVQGETPRSIGPCPLVTENLRKTDKLQLVRQDLGVTKLFHTEKKQYMACASNGIIDFVDSTEDANTEWIMDKASHQIEGGSIFRSKLHNLYLSYEDTWGDDELEKTQGDNPDGAETKQGHFSNLFGGKKEKMGMLVGAETMGTREVWKLEPAMPRAVSSDKLKVFALGTSIAVGTTIALPFALAGVSVVLGAVGAEVISSHCSVEVYY